MLVYHEDRNPKQEPALIPIGFDWWAILSWIFFFNHRLINARNGSI